MSETFKELRTYACGCSVLEVDDSLGQYSGTYPEPCKEHADRGNGPALGYSQYWQHRKREVDEQIL